MDDFSSEGYSIEGKATSWLATRTNQHGKKVVKIVLTGGPCAGKSTCIDRVRKLMEHNYSATWKVYCVAEAASVLYSTGRICRSEMTELQIKRWQRDITECILTFERAYDNIAQIESERHTLILCDRGAMDPKVYTPEGMWPEILKDIGTCEEELIERYDKVFVLHSAPKSNYTKSNNAARRENSSEAALIDCHYIRAWERHPIVVEVMSNKEDCFEEKIQEVWEQIRTLVL